MALITEDGTGKPDAESYLSVEDANSYHTAREAEAWALGDQSAKEAALRRATAYLDGRYRHRWPGERMRGRSQALPWPRRYAYDADDLIIAFDEIPIELRNATAEAALRELASPGSLTPDMVAAQRIVQETVGPITTRYSDKGGANSVRPVVTVIDEMLSGILGRQSLYSGTVVRA